MKYSSLYWSPMMLINVDANVTDPTSHSALLALCVAKVWYWTYTQSHDFARWNVLEVTQQHGWLVWFVTMSKLNSHANGISRDLVIWCPRPLISCPARLLCYFQPFGTLNRKSRRTGFRETWLFDVPDHWYHVLHDCYAIFNRLGH